MSPITAFGVGLLLAFCVSLAIEVFLSRPASDVHQKPSDFMSRPIRGAYTGQITFACILMFIYAVVRGAGS